MNSTKHDTMKPSAVRHRWSAEHVAILIRLYPDTRTAEIASQLGTTVKRVYYKAADLGLKKSAAYLASPDSGCFRSGVIGGIAGRFKPGHVPWNSGMKGLDLGGKATQFKPGERRGNAVALHQPIGTERLSKEGYLERKINDDLPLQRRWRAVHILLWEAAHGPVPKGHALRFRDGDKRNISIDNLELVTRADMMRRNSLHNYPKEVAQLVQLRAAINRQINKRSKA